MTPGLSHRVARQEEGVDAGAKEGERASCPANLGADAEDVGLPILHSNTRCGIPKAPVAIDFNWVTVGNYNDRGVAACPTLTLGSALMARKIRVVVGRHVAA